MTETTATTWSVYDAHTGERVADLPNIDPEESGYLSPDGAWWSLDRFELVSAAEAGLTRPDRCHTYHSARRPGGNPMLPAYGEVIPVVLHADGVTEYQVRERGNHSAATPGEAIVSRHSRYDLAAASAREHASGFQLVNPGGYGYRWDITDQDGREINRPWRDV